jgi:hypothetical protein
LRRIDYDTEQHQDYARGRALTEQQLRTWIKAWAADRAAGLDSVMLAPTRDLLCADHRRCQIREFSPPGSA